MPNIAGEVMASEAIYIYIYARFLDQWSIFLVSSNIYTRVYFVELIHARDRTASA
jgi:hypothetical protein